MPYLIHHQTTAREKVYQLKSGLNTVGRLLNNDIVLSDSSISRNHADIEVKPNETIVKDLNSKNHTFVNGIQIRESRLQEGDVISFGNVTFTYVSTYRAKSSPVKQDDQPRIIKKVNSEQNVKLFENLASPQVTDHSLIKIPTENSEQRILEKLKILLEVSKQLCSPEKPQQILAKVLELLFKVIDVDRAVILLVNELSNKLELKAVKVGDGLEDSGQFYSSKIANLVRETGDAILTADALRDERFNQAKSIVSSSVHASICVPLKTNEKIIGVLYVDNLFMPSVYADEDVEFLTGLANQAAAAIHMANEFYKREQEFLKREQEFKRQIDELRQIQEHQEDIAKQGEEIVDPILQWANKIRNRHNKEMGLQHPNK